MAAVTVPDHPDVILSRFRHARTIPEITSRLDWEVCSKTDSGNIDWMRQSNAIYAIPHYYTIDGGKLPPIDPAEWVETDLLDVVYNRTTRTAFYVRINNDWKAAARCMVALDDMPDGLPSLSRQALATRPQSTGGG